VKVYADGALVQDGLTGRAVPLDPGKYTFEFALPSGRVLRNQTLVREGEKNRIISVREPAVRVEAAPREHISESASPGAPPPAFWVSAGVGAAALASFSAFALLGRSKQSSLDECSPQCPETRRDDFDAMRRDYLVADVSLGVGAVSAGLAAWIFFSSQPASHVTSPNGAQSLARVSVFPLISADGARLVANAVAF
jgi:hypothetical protein